MLEFWDFTPEMLSSCLGVLQRVPRPPNCIFCLPRSLNSTINQGSVVPCIRPTSIPVLAPDIDLCDENVFVWF